MPICKICELKRKKRVEMEVNEAKSNEFETWRMCPECGYEAMQPTTLKKAAILAPVGLIVFALTGIWIG